MNKYSNRPNGVRMAVFWMSAGSMGTWWYPLTRSMTEKNLQPWSLVDRSCNEGKGYLSWMVAKFNRR
jgi:hypothetical protein